MSTRHNLSADPAAQSPSRVTYLAAARDTVLAVGWRRTTLTEIAKRAGVSRMTLYRAWPEMSALLGDLLVWEWTNLMSRLGPQGASAAGEGSTAPTPPSQLGAAELARLLCRISAALAHNELFTKIREVDPELLLPYLFSRRGRNQQHFLEVVSGLVQAGQNAGQIRSGDSATIAATLLLALQGHVLSRATVLDHVPEKALDDELVDLIERYLAP